MSQAAITPELARVPVSLIDEPDIAMRQSFDPVAMEDLAQSIREYGVIQSLVLIRNGERYRVAAGHRRKIASTLAGVPDVPALIFPEGTSTEEALKVAENSERERVNPADEAIYYARLLSEKCDNDVLKLCGLVGKKQSYVEGRLILLTGYDEVFEALRNGRINLSVAVELNKYKDPGFALVDLQTAMESGLTARYIVRLRTDRERLAEAYPPTPPPDGAVADYQPPPTPKQECCLCGEGEEPWHLEVIYIHRVGPCKKLLARALGQTDGGGE